MTLLIVPLAIGVEHLEGDETGAGRDARLVVRSSRSRCRR